MTGRPEQALHIALVTALLGPLMGNGERNRALGLLPPPWMVWHTPNGGGRSLIEASIFKGMGVRAGMPDLFVLGPCPYLIAIELKRPPAWLKSGKRSQAAPRVSPDQRKLIAALSACGVETIVASDIDDALQTLAARGVPLRGMGQRFVQGTAS